MTTIEASIGLGIIALGCLCASAVRPRARRVVDAVHRSPVVVLARRRRARSTAATSVAVAVVFLVAGVFAAALVVAAVSLHPHLADHRSRRRRQAALATTFPDFVDLLILTVRSGCTPVQAFRALVTSAPQPVRATVVAVVRRVDDGERFADAMSELSRRLGAIAQPLGDALALADRHGTPLGPTLDRLADESRSQRRRNADIAARQLPIRLSFPLVGCTLPSFVLLTIVPLMAGTLSSLPGLHP